MQSSIRQLGADSDVTEGDEVTRAQAEVAARKAGLTQSLRRAERSGQSLVRRLEGEIKPAVVAGLAVAAVATVAGLTFAAIRRSRSRRSPWLPPPRPSALGVAARGVGVFLLRLAARQAVSHLAARLEAPATAPSASPYPEQSPAR